MRAVILEAPGCLRLTHEARPPQPSSGEALVRVKRVGVCGTDFHAFKGEQPFFEYPRILGHELGVEIVSLGTAEHASGLAPGDRCAVEPYLNCGRCSACVRGRSNCCLHLGVVGVHIDGGMQEFLTVPQAKLHKSAIVPLEQLALVEMLCIGHHAVRRARIEEGESVLVIGAGPIGLSVILWARLAGANVAVREISEHRLTFCRRHFGKNVLIAGQGDSPTELERLLPGGLPTTVFDATGNRSSMMAAFRYLAHGGTLVFVGFVQGDITFSDSEFHRREVTLLASRNATSDDFGRVMRALEAKEINLAPWITHRASPEETVDEFEHWMDPRKGVIKALIEF